MLVRFLNGWVTKTNTFHHSEEIVGLELFIVCTRLVRLLALEVFFGLFLELTGLVEIREILVSWRGSSLSYGDFRLRTVIIILIIVVRIFICELWRCKVVLLLLLGLVIKFDLFILRLLLLLRCVYFLLLKLKLRLWLRDRQWNVFWVVVVHLLLLILMGIVEISLAFVERIVLGLQWLKGSLLFLVIVVGEERG